VGGLKKTGSSPVIGVDMGGTKILAAVVRGDGKILGRAKNKTKAEQGPEEVIGRITETVRQAAAAAGVTLVEIAAVGIGAPGPLDPEEGIVFHTPNMPGWHNVPLGRHLSEVLGIPAFVDNDVNIGTLGEYVLGAGRGTRDMVGIFVGTGVGGGVILDGKLRSGARHAAGEVGHMVIAAGGPYCGCGRQGCLESVASRTAIVRDIRAGITAGRENLLSQIAGRQLKRITSGVLAKAWRENCPLTREVLGRVQWYLGLHASAIVNLLDPEMLVYGGGVVEALGESFLDPIRVVAEQHYIHQKGAPIRVVAAQLGDDAGILGGAVMARRRVAG
jgi:glucokinase